MTSKSDTFSLATPNTHLAKGSIIQSLSFLSPATHPLWHSHLFTPPLSTYTTYAPLLPPASHTPPSLCTLSSRPLPPHTYPHPSTTHPLFCPRPLTWWFARPQSSAGGGLLRQTWTQNHVGRAWDRHRHINSPVWPTGTWLEKNQQWHRTT